MKHLPMALPYTIAIIIGGRATGVVKDWLLIVLSVLLYKSTVSATSLIGYVIAFVGVKYYNSDRVAAIRSAAEAKDGEALEEVKEPLVEQHSMSTTCSSPAATPRCTA
jgi:transposase